VTCCPLLRIESQPIRLAHDAVSLECRDERCGCRGIHKLELNRAALDLSAFARTRPLSFDRYKLLFKQMKAFAENHVFDFYPNSTWKHVVLFANRG
jgi:hypothetical protein